VAFYRQYQTIHLSSEKHAMHEREKRIAIEAAKKQLAVESERRFCVHCVVGVIVANWEAHVQSNKHKTAVKLRPNPIAKYAQKTPSQSEG
jgi:hypothetical protein